MTDKVSKARTALIPAWTRGWYRFASRKQSPNFGPRPDNISVDLVVIHAISLPPGEYQGDAVEQLFTNQLDWSAHPYYQSIHGLKVSAHFFIRRNGDLLQFVSCDERAWHAGTSQHRGREQCNDFSIGIELEGLEPQGFEDAQYETLSSLSAAILQAYPVASFAGHEHVALGRKSDPGKGFDWDRLQKDLGLADEYFATTDHTLRSKVRRL